MNQKDAGKWKSFPILPLGKIFRFGVQIFFLYVIDKSYLLVFWQLLYSLVTQLIWQYPENDIWQNNITTL
jgi:hypothetical protein